MIDGAVAYGDAPVIISTYSFSPSVFGSGPLHRRRAFMACSPGVSLLGSVQLDAASSVPQGRPVNSFF